MQYIQAKSILSKLKTTDEWFGITYNMNLYRGCAHGCIYCDTRSDCYRVGDISRISVKENALDLLPVELASKKIKATIGTGSMNDPYMPVEKELEITRRALQMISSYRFPVHIITKSDLVERDKDIIRDIEKVYAAVSFTITTADDGLARKIEPFAPLSSARFKAMETLAKEGIYTGVTMMPVLPFINDTDENLRLILQKAKDAGASYILPMFGVSLRKGSSEYFYRSLNKDFPGMKERYQSLFGEQYICSSPRYKQLLDIFYETCDRLDLETKMRFYHPPINKQQSLF